MTVNKTQNGSTLNVAIEGRIDTMTAPQLEAELEHSVSGITELAFDFANVEYISSAGLRVLQLAHKVMKQQGSMVIRNVNKSVMDVFEITGFSGFLSIE